MGHWWIFVVTLFPSMHQIFRPTLPHWAPPDWLQFSAYKIKRPYLKIVGETTLNWEYYLSAFSVTLELCIYFRNTFENVLQKQVLCKSMEYNCVCGLLILVIYLRNLSWICLSLDFSVYDSEALYQLLCIFKILLSIRIIEIFDFIKNPF